MKPPVITDASQKFLERFLSQWKISIERERSLREDNRKMETVPVVFGSVVMLARLRLH